MLSGGACMYHTLWAAHNDKVDWCYFGNVRIQDSYNNSPASPVAFSYLV